MSPGLIHYLAAIGIAALAVLITILFGVAAREAWSAAHDWRRAREWRRGSRRRSSSTPAQLVPLSPALRAPRLGERVWLAHDPVDPAMGGVVCEVALVERETLVVHRGVPLLRVSRLPPP